MSVYSRQCDNEMGCNNFTSKGHIITLLIVIIFPPKISIKCPLYILLLNIFFLLYSSEMVWYGNILFLTFWADVGVESVFRGKYNTDSTLTFLNF